MGLLDQVIGSVTGGHQASPSPQAASGTSPLTKALLMLLAAKAASHYFGKSHETAPSGATPGGEPAAPSGKIESGILAGMPSLDSILDKFRSGGKGDAVESWIGTGENKTIAPADLGSALTPEQIEQLQKATGLPKDQLLAQLSQALPHVVDKLTPDGKLPGPGERGHW